MDWLIGTVLLLWLAVLLNSVRLFAIGDRERRFFRSALVSQVMVTLLFAGYFGDRLAGILGFARSGLLRLLPERLLFLEQPENLESSLWVLGLLFALYLGRYLVYLFLSDRFPKLNGLVSTYFSHATFLFVGGWIFADIYNANPIWVLLSLLSAIAFGLGADALFPGAWAEMKASVQNGFDRLATGLKKLMPFFGRFARFIDSFRKNLLAWSQGRKDDAKKRRRNVQRSQREARLSIDDELRRQERQIDDER